MSLTYDLLLRGGRVIDPVNGFDGPADVAVAEGRVAVVREGIDPVEARQTLDVTGKTVMPGIVDLHVHASEWLGGRYGHKMLALAGVTTALDMSGPVAGVLDLAREYGTGLNIATIQYVRPEHTVADTSPNSAELEALLEKCLADGCIGFKLLGGHYPLTPEATARTIEIVNKNKAYVAFHAGTTEKGSNLEGFLQAVELAAGHSLHIAHANSYCRGIVKPYMEETEEAINALAANPAIRTESYLSPLNGTSAKCSDGQPESLVTRKCLQTGGFAPTEKGMEDAILAGWAQINMEEGDRVVLAVGAKAAAYWRGKGTDTTVSFLVNPPEPRLRLVTARRQSGSFVVDAISTDGGGIPRNVIVEMGLSLVKLQALTMGEFVLKCSTNPARVLGLVNKGHLTPGADADITVLDCDRQEPYLSMANGAMIMYRGLVVGHGARIVTTAAGADSVRGKGLAPIVVDLSAGSFYQKRA